MLEDEVLRSRESSKWLRDALQAALACDPVRVANDAQYLARLLEQRAGRLAEEAETKFPERWIPKLEIRKVKVTRR